MKLKQLNFKTVLELLITTWIDVVNLKSDQTADDSVTTVLTFITNLRQIFLTIAGNDLQIFDVVVNRTSIIKNFFPGLFCAKYKPLQ